KDTAKPQRISDGRRQGVVRKLFGPRLTHTSVPSAPSSRGSTSITESIFRGATMLGSVPTGGANFIGAGTGLPPNIFLSLSNFDITSAVFTETGPTFTLGHAGRPLWPIRSFRRVYAANAILATLVMLRLIRLAGAPAGEGDNWQVMIALIVAALISVGI